MPNPFLSKSQYLRGLQCHKSVWLLKNSAHLQKKPNETQQALFKEGRLVEEWAQQLFPNGVKIECQGSDFKEKIAQTQKLIELGVKTIYEADLPGLSE